MFGEECPIHKRQHISNRTCWLRERLKKTNKKNKPKKTAAAFKDLTADFYMTNIYSLWSFFLLQFFAPPLAIKTNFNLLTPSFLPSCGIQRECWVARASASSSCRQSWPCAPCDRAYGKTDQTNPEQCRERGMEDERKSSRMRGWNGCTQKEGKQRDSCRGRGMPCSGGDDQGSWTLSWPKLCIWICGLHGKIVRSRKIPQKNFIDLDFSLNDLFAPFKSKTVSLNPSFFRWAVYSTRLKLSGSSETLDHQ